MRVYEKNFIYRVRKINNKLLLMSTKECFEINEITKDIFDYLDEKKREEDIINYLKSIYNEVNEEEVKQFLISLFDKGIIELC